ncbi:MAG: DUF4388 domain-containing protein [Pyrinomonadaceae bacterium]
MNGQLSDLPLAELVREISSKGLSGTVRLQHESVKAAVYLDAGQIIYAASNARELRLAEYLKKQGLVSETQLSAVGRHGSDASLISALCDKGIIDPKAVESLIARQVSDLLRVMLLWTKGTWEFDDRSHLGDSVRVKIDMPGLLLQTARKIKPEFAAKRFLAADELISPVADLPICNELLPAEGFVLSRVDRPISLSELIALSGLPEPEATRTIYGLVMGGFVEREKRSNALAKTQSKASRRVVSAPKPEEAPPPEPPSSQSEQTEEERLEDLNRFLARLDNATNHYEVLDVSTTAPSEKIKSSYYALARSYHPDRFHLQSAELLHGHIESAFARITQAYETLTDARRRAGYDAKLAAEEKARHFAQSAPKASQDSRRAKDAGFTASASDELERAEKAFKEGFAALQQGQAKIAITNLAAAARAAPKDARYRAYYGRALAADESKRRLAESELQAAVKLDPGNASYHVMLAELYCDLGLFRRAEGELERAVSTDPNNADAQKLIRRLEAARTTK